MQGPLEDIRNIEAEEIITVEDFFPQTGTPVACYGLKGSLSHLNGRIGDLRSCDDNIEFFQIHFEGDEEMMLYEVHRSNFRILFELPDVE